MENRRASRYRLKILHEHRSGGRIRRRVSELIFVDGQPRIILGWIDLGGVRAPIFLHNVDASAVHPLGVKHFYRYDGVTSDPQDTQRLPAARNTPAG
ncbi:MAG TPA: hypothetical protein VHL85_03295 [Burkholderiales bacterium]|jgi:hypothetical protein|nr:hypothetical protein [Burkholderiales bacterium]